MPLLAYWDIYKNYYANKSEEIGAIINNLQITNWIWKSISILSPEGETIYMYRNGQQMPDLYLINGQYLVLEVPKNSAGIVGNNLQIFMQARQAWWSVQDLGQIGQYDTLESTFVKILLQEVVDNDDYINNDNPNTFIKFIDPIANKDEEIKITTFNLSKIDEMREKILAKAPTSPYVITDTAGIPYNACIQNLSNGYPSAQMSQCGLGLKTYQSDIFNNWLNSEWLDGDNGINKITAISTTDDYFTLDTLNLSKKVYDMLNRIAVSGGSYNDWIEAVYGEQNFSRAESPVYMGGLSKEVIFSEVVSTAEANEDNPLGTLAGKGRLSGKHKGGKIIVKCKEPCMIMGIVSLTPRVDYSQGNDWTTRLINMDDLHKPSLDEIGFQDLITDQMAFWDTDVIDDTEILHSAGKQPAWLNYMTNHNKCYGNFADPRKEMYMTLNRRYEPNLDGNIKDLTTYIDPEKYNYMFAQTALDSQNFWVQIAIDCTARRKMSAKIMPNL